MGGEGSARPHARSAILPSDIVSALRQLGPLREQRRPECSLLFCSRSGRGAAFPSQCHPQVKGQSRILRYVRVRKWQSRTCLRARDFDCLSATELKLVRALSQSRIHSKHVRSLACEGSCWSVELQNRMTRHIRAVLHVLLVNWGSSSDGAIYAYVCVCVFTVSAVGWVVRQP